MAFIDPDFYASEFKGTPIPESRFDRLAEIASDTIDGLITVSMTDDEKKASMAVKKATAYQLEFLSEHGGVDAILGFSYIGVTSESLGDYSVSSGSKTKIAHTTDGIPVSPMALSLLRKEGLMCRWMYADRYDRRG